MSINNRWWPFYLYIHLKCSHLTVITHSLRWCGGGSYYGVEWTWLLLSMNIAGKDSRWDNSTMKVFINHKAALLWLAKTPWVKRFTNCPSFLRVSSGSLFAWVILQRKFILSQLHVSVDQILYVVAGGTLVNVRKCERVHAPLLCASSSLLGSWLARPVICRLRISSPSVCLDLSLLLHLVAGCPHPFSGWL